MRSRAASCQNEAYPDVRIISEEELKAAIEEGKSRARPAEETGAHA